LYYNSVDNGIIIKTFILMFPSIAKKLYFHTEYDPFTFSVILISIIIT